MSDWSLSTADPRWVLKVSCVLLLALSNISCQTTKNGGEPEPPDPVLEPSKEAEEILAAYLDAAVGKVENAKDVYCLLVRTEVIGDNEKASPEEWLDFKQRFNPHTLRLKWVGKHAKGRQLLYTAGENDDKVLIREPGIISGLLGVMRFDLTSSMITSKSRYGPDVAGYNGLVNRVDGIFRQAVEAKAVTVAASTPVMHRGIEVLCFEVLIDREAVDMDVSKMILWFDVERSLPIHTIIYDGRGRAVEDYDWRHLILNADLSDADFEI